MAAVALWGMASLAQEVEPPFTWNGKGVATVIAEYGVNDINFQIDLSVDAQGGFKGKTSNEEGESAIKHVFYGERMDYEIPGLFSRKAIVVLLINEGGDNPMLAVLNGRLLAGRLFSGEVLLKRYEAGSESDKALGVGNPVATPIDEDYLPSSLKAALKKCAPFGTVKIEGAYKQ